METNRLMMCSAGVGLAFAVWASCVNAAEAPVPELPNLSAAEIVARNVAARGGADAWRAINAVSYSGVLDAGVVRPDNGLNPASRERLLDKPGKSARLGQSPDDKPLAVQPGTPVSLAYTLVMERPTKQRMEIKFKDETLVQVYDGTEGWKLQPYLNRGDPQRFSQDEMQKAKEFQDIDGPLIDCASKGTTVSLDGTDRVGGKPAYRLKLALRNGAIRRVWVDAKTFLDVQVDGSRRFNGREVAVYTELRDFRTVANVKVPYVMETRTEGTTDHERIVVEKVVLNPKVDASLFSKPT